jgi:hypothetical protein
LIVSYCDIDDIPDELLPNRYEEQQVSPQVARNLMNTKCKRRSQVDGLTFHKCQMPTHNDNKQWEHVIRRPTSKKNWREQSAYVIRCPVVNDVYIQYFSGDIDCEIGDAVKYYMKTHTPVRIINGEKGSMVGVGRRFDVRSGSTEMFKATRNCSQHLSKSDEICLRNSCLLSFDSVLRKSIVANEYNNSMHCLKGKRNVMSVAGKNVLPSYCCSESLTNSMHIDTNDSERSYTLFFSRQQNVGKTWFVMPELSVALELKGTVMLSWDGSKVLHGSVTVDEGMLSLFGSAHKDVEEREKIKQCFASKEKGQFTVGDKVHVRKRLKDVKCSLDPKLSVKFHQSKRFSNRKATIVDINGDGINVIYEGHFRKHGNQVCSESEICSI